ncbi:alkaline shock response membrane anchor protein AmaP [Geosporobacter ferrireducens]|uniref:Alkaline shock response membrane anchor protein AmaP n=1 Tax=Geosporobacter ferrireducens TaxID=1424294 RepID=A0A1D8GB67_9FIRM|nr:alkaline shock response membrane anchor protein AmaP [Geosporobacter ferrireducens]AOT68155.1 hypothetical protein Gferi_00295 [Geosporobacter ferrireducens]MTI54204.1 alkaline shock response membrane anchor protein AmaP [Geosporobacter ferrireducens]
MKLLDRIILTLYSFSIGILSLLLLVVPFHTGSYEWTRVLLENLRHNWQNILFPLFFLGVSIWFLISGLRYNRSKQHAVIRHTAFGEVKITLNTLEGMAQKSAKSVPGLREIKASVQQVAEGVIIQIESLAISDTNIPEATVKVQQSIKEYIEEFTGITVQEVKVTIQDISTINKGRVE